MRRLTVCLSGVLALLAGDVFTPDLIETWIELKRDDIDAVRLRPHPHEFELYYDV